MNIADIYREEGYAGLVELAAKVDANPKYLYQCATNRRSLSRDMIERLMAVDSRLTLEAMFAQGREAVNG